MPIPNRDRTDENPGYEVQDVNVGGVVTFLAGLCGFLLIFFVFCFVMGKAINTGLLKEDGPADRWHGYNAHQRGEAGSAGMPVQEPQFSRKREDMTSNVTLQQREFANTTLQFPTPRLETDDGNQDITDLHAREDLLLENYSTSGDLPNGAVRIPIERAMELVVQRGLPKAATGTQSGQTTMVGDATPVVSAPLTTGFARTGYELDQMAAREQKLELSQEAKR
jgi:hypothetical protein